MIKAIQSDSEALATKDDVISLKVCLIDTRSDIRLIIGMLIVIAAGVACLVVKPYL